VFKITIEGDGLKTINSFIDGALAAQYDLEMPAVMIRVFGMFTQSNFNKSGQEFGSKWQKVSKYTQEIRRQRGKNPVAPPLMPNWGPTGWLYLSSAKELSEWPLQNTSRQFVDAGKYHGKPSDGPTVVVITSSPGHAVIKMQGAKAAHMTGDTSGAHIGFAQYRSGGYGSFNPGRYGGGFLPARPFWGLNQRMMDVMGDGVIDAYVRNWSHYAEKMGAGMVYFSANTIASLRWRAL
jgi:hypothetical protein